MLQATKKWLALMLVSFAFTGLVYADEHEDAVEVTLNVNTATVPDTLTANDYVQVRGQIREHDWENEEYLDQAIRWNVESDIVADNQGGDYWQATVNILPGDTLEYKFWVGHELDDDQAAAGGWEDGDNRVHVVPEEQEEDMEVDLVYWNRGDDPLIEAKEDTVGVHFRVNMGQQANIEEFDPEEDGVQARGNRTPLTWDDQTAADLELEEASEGDNLFYSGTVYFDVDDLVADDDEAEDYEVLYKYVMGDDGWESIDNRSADLSSLADTTLHWAYFDNEPLEDAELVETDITFGVNVEILESLGIFSEGAGDAMAYPGTHNGWATGEDDQMSFSAGNNRWQATLDRQDPPIAIGSTIDFKYFVVWDESREDEDSEHYIPELAEAGLDVGWEEPGTTGGADRQHEVVDQSEQNVFSDAENYDFFNGISSAGLIASALIPGEPETYPVTFEINMEPATTADQVENENDRFDPDDHDVYMAVEEQILAMTQEWPIGIGDPGEDGGLVNANQDVIDQFTFEETEEDYIYELTLELDLSEINTVNSFGFRIGYGDLLAEDGDVFWAGGGYDYGRRYYQFIEPTNVEDLGDDFFESTWPEEVVMNRLDFKGGEDLGGDDLTVETAPDYRALATSTEESFADRPAEVELNQNYPNPFNPTTTIEFNIPETQDVTLEVYNVVGQHVATLIDGQKRAGSHTVQFNASDLASGMYIYRLQTGDVVQQKQMTFIK